MSDRAAQTNKTPILEARRLHKRFLGVHALDDVTAAFYPGEIVAVMGENGAGKSTLMKCLAGVHQPSDGEICYEGQPAKIESVRRAEELGIAFIHQELNLADNLSAGANIFLGREPRKLGFFVDGAAIRERTADLLAQLGLRFSPDTRVQDLSIGHQQMVEIAKALSQDAKVLIMDEPTSSLSQGETDTLFQIVRGLRDAGICVVFISHRLAEVKEIADRVIVLKDGRNSGELAKGEITHDRIVSMMVGRDLKVHQKGATDRGEPLLKVRSLRTTRFPKNEVSFEICGGEIVGMAGLVGAGRTELARAIFGIDKPEGGTAEACGRRLKPGNPRHAIASGVAFVPEDRKQEGVIVEMSIRDNIAMAGLGGYQTAGFVHDRAVDAAAESAKDKLRIKSPDIHKQVALLSGGNQQKVVLAKWIALSPKVFLLDEPTRGIDVGSKSEIYEVMESIAAEGAAVLFISSEMEELLRVSDRVLVMHEGQLAGELAREAMTEQAIMNLATGKH